jgi:hypothetical protein
MTFGSGQPLRQFSPHLRDPKECKEIILDRTERNSVIEGLPRFDAKIRKACEERIDATAASPRARR